MRIDAHSNTALPAHGYLRYGEPKHGDLFHVHARERAVVSPSATVSAIGNQIMDEDWSYAFWTQGFSVVHGLEGSWHEFFGTQPDSVREGIGGFMWLLAMVHEFSIAASFQPDGAHLLLHIGSYSADPPEAYKAYQAAVLKNFDRHRGTVWAVAGPVRAGR